MEGRISDKPENGGKRTCRGMMLKHLWLGAVPSHPIIELIFSFLGIHSISLNFAFEHAQRLHENKHCINCTTFLDKHHPNISFDYSLDGFLQHKGWYMGRHGTICRSGVLHFRNLEACWPVWSTASWKCLGFAIFHEPNGSQIGNAKAFLSCWWAWCRCSSLISTLRPWNWKSMNLGHPRLFCTNFWATYLTQRTNCMPKTEKAWELITNKRLEVQDKQLQDFDKAW